MDMQDELMDRFGDIPKNVENLLVIARIRALAHKCYVTEVLVKEKEVKLTMYQKAKINVGGIPDLVNSYGGALKLVPGEAPVFHYVERKPKGITIEDMLFKAEEIFKGIKKAADVRVRSFLIRCTVYRHLNGFYLYPFYLSKVSGKGADLILGTMEHNTDYGYTVFPTGNSQSGNDHRGVEMKFSFITETDCGSLIMQLITAKRSSMGGNSFRFVHVAVLLKKYNICLTVNNGKCLAQQ